MSELERTENQTRKWAVIESQLQLIDPALSLKESATGNVSPILERQSNSIESLFESIRFRKLIVKHDN
jgi:hypothetical protein